MISKKKSIKQVDYSNYYSKLFVIFLLLFSFPAISQEKTIIDNLAEQFNLNTINESKLSVYLQTSKDIYETEENLWFKGYALDAQTFSPSQKNKTLYVQLISEDKKNIFWKEK